jgi:hypothetical protein
MHTEIIWQTEAAGLLNCTGVPIIFAWAEDKPKLDLVMSRPPLQDMFSLQSVVFLGLT